jgi:hypothetical protein
MTNDYSNTKYRKPLLTLNVVGKTSEFNFRHVRKIAKCDYFHCHVCPSVRAERLGAH